MNVLLLQLDGKGVNLALMRLAAHHRGLGDSVELRRAMRVSTVERQLGDDFDRVYASAIFTRSRPIADRLRTVYPKSLIGGTGVDETIGLESVGVATDGPVDYTDYLGHQESVGFSQRGCRLRCPFCVVPLKEGRPRAGRTIAEIWRGEPWPKWILLLDNDFFGVPGWWQERIEEMRTGGFRVCFNQGINARMLTPEAATAIASVDYRDDSFQRKRIYTSWDNLPDEDKLFRGLQSLVDHGVKPDHIMVYMLVGYWPNETTEDREYRRRRLREFGCRPYPMPYVRTPELVGFQRWVVGAYDKRIGWNDWRRAGYEPRKLGHGTSDAPLFNDSESDR
jgi:hypothetical protein